MKLSDRPCLKIPGLLCCLMTLLQLRSEGQTANSVATRSYDTLLTGNGYGNYQVNFPQWNSDSGLLVSAKLNARVTLHYGFTVKNVDNNPSTYAIIVGREDQISGAALSSPYDSTVEQKIGSFPLNPGQSATMAPFTFLNNYSNIDSITGNTAPFLGTGTVNFTYTPFTYADVRASNNASYYYGTAGVLDTIHFSLTYLYSPIITLATTLVSFAAVLEDPATVALTWETTGEQPGRQYEVQAARDGQTFLPLTTLAATLPSAPGAPSSGVTPPSDPSSPGAASPGASPSPDPSTPSSPGAFSPGISDYTYNYSLPADKAGKWYFRLKIIAAGGAISYSPVQLLTIGGAGGALSLYPNPATDHVTVLFDPGVGGGPARDWQVDLVAADGSLLLRNYYWQATSGRIDFQRVLPAGLYFVRVLDLQGHKWSSAPLLLGLSPH